MLLFVFMGFTLHAFQPSIQDTLKSKLPDSLKVMSKADSAKSDSIQKKKQSGVKLKSKVDFKATDSLRFEVDKQKVYMFKDADVKYEDISMKSAYLEIDFPKSEVYATGVPDSTGKDQGIPDFAQGALSFKSKEMRYNYDTKRGFIKTVFTKQDEGYLHGTVVKKMENDVTYVKNGAYTTCDRPDDPHFAFRFGRAKVIPGKRVITGPAFMEIAGVSTPIIVPFGYFPSRSGRHSGILMPTYGETDNRGFYFQNMGYYWAINQYMDLTVQGDIYTHGSWAVRPSLRYTKRYKYTGGIRFGYALNRIGSQDAPDFQIKKDFEFHWSHAQDSKARPRSTFSANVNIVSNTYNQYNLSSSTQNYLSNTFTSSVNYSTNFGGKVYLNLNFNHNQNTLSKSINLTLPQVALSVNQFYPFRRKNPVGNLKWYENISMKYNLDLENRYYTYDSLLFRGNWIDSLQNGIRHSIPISASIRVLKFFTWTNSVNFTDRMYFKTIRKYYQKDTIINAGDTLLPGYKTRQVSGFANAIDASFSSSINTRIYGMYQFKKGPLVAIRHMVTPSLSFSYSPDFAGATLGYYRYIENDTNTINPQKYSIFQQGIYGSPPQYRAGVVSFGLSNNLEMKVRNRKDTVTGTKKIPLIDDLSLRISYDLTKDSLNWSPLQLSARSTLMKGLSIQYAAQWDMYAHDSLGRRMNITTLKAFNKLLKFDNSSVDIGFNYSLSSDKLKKKKPAPTVAANSTQASTPATTQEKIDAVPDYDYYVDFDIPWSFNINYNFHYTNSYSSAYMHNVDQVVQTLGVSGQLNITPKWKISLTTGWDFTHGQISYTSIDVYRDLHCWEMRFGWIPKGGQQSWSFSINIKASMLQDLKLNKKKDFRDFTN
ncbi:MAG: putative LPS assembly protein LptD [Bacteroidetes bacterium]|nr:putative LPS assembly protein LptD [Bacteroidota bacterium]